MASYKLLGRALLATGNYRNLEPEPFGNSGLAVLSDGTFFASVWMEQNAVGSTGYPLRMWHLAKDLSVLGTVDVVSNYSFVPYAVPLSGNRVLSICSTVQGGDHQTTTSIVDCSQAVPVPGPITTFPVGGFRMVANGHGGPQHVLDLARNRVIVGSLGGIQIISLITGGLLGTWVNSSWTPMALAQDPANPFHYVAASESAVDWDFTIAADNTITLNSSFNVPPGPLPYQYPLGEAPLPLPTAVISNNGGPLYPQWPAGDPVNIYGGLPPNVVVSKTSQDNLYQYFKGSSNVLASFDSGRIWWGDAWAYEWERTDNKRGPFQGYQSREYVNVTGLTATLAAGRHQVCFYESGSRDNYYGWTDYAGGDYLAAQTRVYNDGGPTDFRLRLLGVDQDHPELGIEVLDLSYFGFPPPSFSPDLHVYSCTPADGSAVSLWQGSPGLAVDQASGVMLVGMTCVNRGGQPEQIINMMVWAIQGPIAGPNLTAQLLPARVRFTP